MAVAEAFATADERPAGFEDTMTLHPPTAGALTVERLGPPDLIETFGFLDRDPVLNVYLLALALRDTLGKPYDEFWAARRGGEIVGLLHLGGRSGAVLPVGDDRPAIRLLAERAIARLELMPRRYQVIGPRTAVDGIVQALAARGAKPRLHRHQSYMALDRGGLAPFERLPALRRAQPADYPLVFESGAQLRIEELHEDPRVVDPEGWKRRVEEECRDGYTHLWEESGALQFRASISAWTPDAAQVSGVYTPPERRNHGIARRALSELCTRLLERSQAVCLFVNDFNAPALRVYRTLGFETRAEWASAFYDGGA